MKGFKFLFIASNDGVKWGGSELLWSTTAERLARSGHEVRVSVRDWDAPIPQVERLRVTGCKIFYRRPPSLLDRLRRKVFSAPAETSEHLRMAGGGVDLVLISQGGNLDGLPWMEAARAGGHRYAVIAHIAAEVWWPDDGTAKRLATSYENASRSYFVSQATLDLSRRQFATPLNGGKVIRNPFHVDYGAQPPWPENSGDTLHLACVARLETAVKGQDLLLQVLSLAHWRERNVKVSFVGQGANEHSLHRMAEILELRNVEFPGYQEDVEEIWRRNHALVLPSRFEGMPLVVVEAMLCGRPCIVTDVGGSRELIRDGASGFLARAATVEFLDEAMSRGWDERHRLMEMGKVAAADVRRWVSKDPTEDFVRELMALAEGAGK